MELLTGTGMSPAEVLNAATAAVADVFGLADRGVVTEGRRADLLLPDGDPTTDVTAVRAVAGVWIAGERVE